MAITLAAVAGAAATATFIASAIYGMLDSIVSGAIKAANSKKLMKMSRKLAEQVTTNQALTNKLTEAYNNKNYKLMNSLLVSSPFAGTYNVLKRNAEQLEKEYKEGKEILDNDSKELSKKQSDLSQIENNLNGGMISAIQGATDLGKYKDHQTSDDVNKIANGGMQITQGDSANYGGAGAIKIPNKKGDI